MIVYLLSTLLNEKPNHLKVIMTQQQIIEDLVSKHLNIHQIQLWYTNYVPNLYSYKNKFYNKLKITNLLNYYLALLFCHVKQTRATLITRYNWKFQFQPLYKNSMVYKSCQNKKQSLEKCVKKLFFKWGHPNNPLRMKVLMIYGLRMKITLRKNHVKIFFGHCKYICIYKFC